MAACGRAAVTYLAFADYERPAMRMAALMGLPVTFVFSHDSIGIGTNGPTHQPVEILASLRAMPNMLVLRPADAVEAAECWADRARTPQRPGVAGLRAPGVAARARGARRRRQPLAPRRLRAGRSRRRRRARVTLLATGSEVALAVQARRALQAEGIATAVVSMPCWELFEAQDAAYRSAVLGPGTVRVAVEAALRFGWDR